MPMSSMPPNESWDSKQAGVVVAFPHSIGVGVCHVRVGVDLKLNCDLRWYASCANMYGGAPNGSFKTFAAESG